jgi:hypothetical protein
VCMAELIDSTDYEVRVIKLVVIYIYYFTSIMGDYLCNTGSVTLTVIDLITLESGLYYTNIFLENLAYIW